ncbi:MAG: hypothetical protein IKX24_11175 [Prevotella sp.]|nr:hypothetical protein [Prevotella sp.]MBR5062682.1 hypothetical protein [Prevotella sp.]
MGNDFETLWHEQKKEILMANEEYRRILDSYKMNSGADWLLFAFPIVVAIVILEWSPTGRELVNWLIAAVAAIITFALCVWVKTLITGNRSLDEVEKEVKEQCRIRFEKTGKLID